MLLSRFIKQHKRANACKCGNALICFDDVDVCFFGLLFQSAQDNILDIASQARGYRSAGNCRTWEMLLLNVSHTISDPLL
jgi:hypothetical protein